MWHYKPKNTGRLCYHRWRLSLLLGLTIINLSCVKPVKERVLTYWCATNPFEVEFAREIVSEWNQDTTRIPVRFQPVPAGQTSEEVVLAAIVAKTTPDIYSNIWPGVIEQYREAGAVLPLHQFADFDSVLTSRIPESLRQEFQSPDGGYYQFPWKGNPLMLFYNRDLLEEAGIDQLPETYAEFFEIAPLLALDRDGDGHFDQWLLDPVILTKWYERFFDFYTFYIAATDGATFLSQGQPQLDRPETAEVFSFFRRGYAEGYFPRSIFQEDIFIKGQLVFHVSGPWLLRHLKKYRPNDYQRYGVTTLPRPKHDTTPVHTYGDAKNIVIFSTTSYPQEAWDFVKFMTNRANDLRFLTIGNQLPLRKDLHTDPFFRDYFDQNPQMVLFAEQIPYVVGTDNSIYLQEIFDIITQEFDAACIYQAKPVEQSVADLQARVQVLIERERY